jgi:hypothetical protein
VNSVDEGKLTFDLKEATVINIKVTVESETDSVLLLGGNRKAI